MPSHILHRLVGRTAPITEAATRLEVCPPAPARRGLAARFAGWFRGPWLETPSARDPRLAEIRDEFHAEIDDIRTIEAGLLKSRIDACPGLRELWLLRAAVYGLVSCHRSQHEAECRLARLNRHFPTRSPKSGLAPLDRLADLDARAR